MNRAREQREAVEFVQQIAQQISEGQSLRGRLNPVDTFTEERTLAQLQQVIAPNDDLAKIEITAVSSSSLPAGAAPDREATHVLLRVAEIDRLGLHVLIGDRGSQPRITGYWLP